MYRDVQVFIARLAIPYLLQPATGCFGVRYTSDPTLKPMSEPVVLRKVTTFITMKLETLKGTLFRNRVELGIIAAGLAITSTFSKTESCQNDALVLSLAYLQSSGACKGGEVCESVRCARIILYRCEKAVRYRS